MIHKRFRMTCNCCNRREFDQGDESHKELLENAWSNGWTRRTVPNGAIWDLCPSCSAIPTEDLG